MKKFFALALAAVMTVSLVACGGGNNSGGNSTSTSSKSEATSTSSSETTESGGIDTSVHRELLFWIPQYQYAEGGISDQDFWDEKLAVFEEQYNCTITTEIMSWTDYPTTVRSGILSGEGPDVVYVTEVYDLIQDELIVPMDQYFTQDEIANYVFWNNGERDANGGLVTMPMMAGNAIVLYYNMDILEACGVTESDLPTTWDEFFELCKTLDASTSKPDGMLYAFVQPWGASTGLSACLTSFWPYFAQAGGELVNANGEVDLNSQATLDTLNFIKRFKDEGIFKDDILTVVKPQERFINGETAIVAAGTGQGGQFTDNNINWKAQLALKGPATDITTISVDSLAISNTAEAPDLCAELIKYITSKDVMDDYHEQVYGMPSLTLDAAYEQPAPFQEWYTEKSDKMTTVPFIKGSDALQETLKQHIHGMLNGEETPEQVIEETMKYYNEQILTQ